MKYYRLIVYDGPENWVNDTIEKSLNHGDGIYPIAVDCKITTQRVGEHAAQSFLDDLEKQKNDWINRS